MVPGIAFSCLSRNTYEVCRRNEKENVIETEILEAPEKPPNDKKEYRVIKLSNGLIVLLISDLASLTDSKSPTPSPDSDLEDSGIAEIDGNATEDEAETEEVVKNENATGEGENEETIKNDDAEGKGVTEETVKTEDVAEEGGEKEETTKNEEDEKEEEEILNEENDKTEMKSQYSAAAALHIGVGSFEDPHEIQGLMHFLEHMVFMGSEKYPIENCFNNFITKYGGSNNAFTCSETTTFYFDVQEAHFEEGLNIFANFFISPLMKVDAMQRERQAVHSEFQNATDSDICRIKQLIGSIANKDHPISFFNYGNEKTLQLQISDQELHSKLHELRSKYYSAQYMTLSIQARETLDKLQELVTSIFSEIPNNELPRPSYESYGFPFKLENYHRYYKVIPLDEIHVLQLSWAFEPLYKKYYESKPTWYIANLIGHEGFGSILSYLKKKVWAFSLMAGGSLFCNSACELFEIDIVLTNEGLLHIKEIIYLVFQYIRMLKNEGPNERIFTEIQKVREIEFNFSEESNPTSNVINSAICMEIYPTKHIFSGSSLLFKYDPLVIEECLSNFRVDNCNVILRSKQFENENLALQEEEWFGTKYCVEDIPQDWIEEWENAGPIPELHLPLPNEFIPDDFNIFKWSDSSQNPPEYPQVIESNLRGKLWFKQDFKYNLPRAYCDVYFRLHEFEKSVEIETMLDMFLNLFTQHIMEAVYPAGLAQYETDISTCDLGFVLHLGGFNQKLYKCLELVLSQIEGFYKILDDKTFNEMKSQQLKCYYSKLLDPEILQNDVRFFVLEGIYWPIVEKMKALEKMEKDCISVFLKEVFPNKFFDMLVQGNITEDEAKKLYNLIINTSSIPDGEIKYLKMPVRRIKQGEHIIRFKSLNTPSSNSTIMNYYQGEWTSMENELLNEFISLAMQEPCFDTLRTQDQLGYSVGCSNLDTFGALGLAINVVFQADKFSLTVVNEKIELFLKTFSETLKNMKEEDVMDMKETMKNCRLIDDVTLREEIVRNFSEISDGDYMFDRHLQELPLISKITIEEAYSYFQKIVSPENNDNYKKLSFQVMGYPTPDKDSHPSYESSLDKSPEEILELMSATEDDLKAGISNDQFVSHLRSYIDQLTLFENPEIND